MSISTLIKKLNIESKKVTLYGKDKAKLDLSLLDTKSKKDSKLILVTAMTPTPKGEGKTTVSIGLADALNYLNHNAVLALREPSLGPVFGLKGGAIGGGKTTIEPANDINLHFNGDFHAITSAHNLLSAIIDNHLSNGNELKISNIVWPRTIDMNDRNLRTIQTKLGDRNFIITAASEIMAILALSLNYEDLKERLSNIIVGYTEENNPVYASQLNCIDAMLILLKDAIKPNLVSSKFGTPTLVHCGPFANVAHGCNSVIATKIALNLGDYVVTEAGFGSDLGAEKFLDIKVPIINKTPDCVVIVATIQAIKYHGNQDLNEGFKNLSKHVENIKGYGLNFVIALNVFDTDSKEDLDTIIKLSNINDYPISTSYGFLKGAKGCVELAQKVVNICKNGAILEKIYYNNDPIYTKLVKLASTIYGAREVELSTRAQSDIKLIESLGLDKYPICVAKTPLSLSGDPKLLGLPTNFVLRIEKVVLNNGSKLIVCWTKGIVLLPGLNEHPRSEFMHFDMKNPEDSKL